MPRAFALATTGRPGAVLVDITTDAQKAMAAFDWEGSVPHRHLRHLPPRSDPEQMKKALKLIKAAKRPVILAGRGIELSGARTEVLWLNRPIRGSLFDEGVC